MIAETTAQNPPLLLLSPADAAKALAVSPKTLARLIAAGDIPAVRVGARRIGIPLDSLREFVNRRLVEGET